MASEKFKVFISWSRPLSKAVASVWYDLVKDSFDFVQPFMSEENIGAGERSLRRIADELSGSSFGIIVVTQENQESQWLNYEAGALSKERSPHSDETVRVAPSVVDFDRLSDVTGPLGQFQASFLDKDGIGYILIEIAKVVGVDASAVMKRFNNAWGAEYEQRFAEAKALGADQPSDAHRDTGDMLDEILTILREQMREQDQARRQQADQARRQQNRESIKRAFKAVTLSSGETIGAALETNSPHRPVKMTFPIDQVSSPETREDVVDAMRELGIEAEFGPPSPLSSTTE